MSADDFQGKCASVMENMLKSAVAETTKLFETMVDELKAELCRIKKENEGLKIRCSLFESETGESGANSGARACVFPEKRDTAVQCDLVSVCTMVVEPSRTLGLTSTQNLQQQHSYEEIHYTLQDHNYQTHLKDNSQMAFDLVNEEQEEVEPTVVCGRVSNSGSPQPTSCGCLNEGCVINNMFSTGEICNGDENTMVTLELPFVEMDSDLQSAQNQSSAGEDPPSIITPSVQERAHAAFRDFEISEVEFLPITIASLNTGLSSEKSTKSQHDMEAQSPEALAATEISMSVPAESPREQSIQFREHGHSVTLQDALLLVEAMNRSTGENTRSCLKLAASSNAKCVPPVDNLETMDYVRAEPQVLPLSTEALGSLITELPTIQSTEQTSSACPQVTDSTSASEAQAQIKVMVRRQVVSPSRNSTPQIPSSATTTQILLSLQNTCHPLMTSVTTSKLNTAIHNKVTVVPSVLSITPQKIAALNQLPTFVSTVVATSNINLRPASKAASSAPGKPSFSPVPRKATYGTSRKVVPTVPSQTPSSTDQQSGNLPDQKITILIPRMLSAVASGTHHSQESELADAITLSSSSQKWSASVNGVASVSSERRRDTTYNVGLSKQSVSGTTCALTETCSLLKRLVPTGYLPAALCPFEQKLNAVVRLKRLPNCVSTKESVLVSRLLSIYPESQSNMKVNLTQDMLSMVTEPPEMLVVSTNRFPCFEETVQENTRSDSSKTCTIVEESYVSGRSSTPLKVSAPAMDSMTKPSDGEPAFNCNLEKGSTALIQLISIPFKNSSDPHSQTTKTPFLAQLAVSPVQQGPKKVSSDEHTDTGAFCPANSTSGARSLPSESLLFRLRSHLKPQLQTRSSETNAETTVSPKKLRLGNDHPNDKNTKNEPMGVFKDVASQNKTSHSLIPNSPRRTGLCKDVFRLEGSVYGQTRRLKATIESPSKSARSSSSERAISSSGTVTVNRSTITQDSFMNRQVKREFSSFSPGRRTSLRVLNAKKLAKAAKAKTIAKMKTSNQCKLWKSAKASRLAGNPNSCEPVKTCKTKAVWMPPRMPASKTPPGGEKILSLLTVKKEPRSPRSLNHTLVYRPSVPINPAPLRAPPFVSPLQPLSVIGGRLLKNQCGECGRILSSSAALESHVSLHTGRRPFSCTLCGKRFSDSKGLKRHGRVHRNGRIHICDECGKGFVYRFGLTKHHQMVHSRIKPFVCQICNKGFFTKRDVEAHIRVHTGEKPYPCNLCGKKFTRRVELNVHTRWHMGEKRHWCSYCGKGFLDSNNLKRHKYTHTGEKPHSCPHCPKHFTQSGHLKKHLKNVHKSD